MGQSESIIQAPLGATDVELKQREEQLEAQEVFLEMESIILNEEDEKLCKRIINNQKTLSRAQVLMQESNRASQQAKEHLSTTGRDAVWMALTLESADKALQGDMMMEEAIVEAHKIETTDNLLFQSVLRNHQEAEIVKEEIAKLRAEAQYTST